MQHVQVERCLRGRRDGGETQHHNSISADPVVLVRRLCALHASKKTRGVEGDCADQSLESKEDVDAQPESAVDRGKVSAVVGGFVVDDDGEARKK